MNDRSHPDRPRSAVWRFLGAALLSFALLVGAAIPAAAAELMRVTFIRHGESYGNSSGLIDTTTPGPVITPLGQQQARDIAAKLGDNNYDGIYASTMVRTQLTAGPMSQYLGLPINVIDGVQEIEAGVFEGTPEAEAQGGYGLYPIGWTFPGVIPQIPVEMFNKGTFMPGTEENGYTFDARVDGALQTIYDNGDRNAAVFSHGGTIMFWTMMNVNNLTVMEKLQLLQTAQLHNTDYVVIEGNNEDGWTLVSWNGQQFAPEPTLGAEVKLQFRTLTRQLTATAQQVAAAFATRDFATIATAINRGIATATHSIVKFQRAVTAKVIHEVDQVIRRISPAPAPAPAPSPESVQTLKDVTDPSTTADQKSKAAAEPEVQAIETEPIETEPIETEPIETEPIETESIETESIETESIETASDAVSNGATDLTNGNKVIPGERAQDSRADASDPVATAVTKLKETAKKFATPKSPKAEATVAADPTGDKGDSGSQESDAA